MNTIYKVILTIADEDYDVTVLSSENLSRIYDYVESTLDPCGIPYRLIRLQYERDTGAWHDEEI